MRSRGKLRWLLFFLLAVLRTISFAQLSSIDSSAYTASLQHAIQLYHQFTAPSSALYNGREYVEYAANLKKGSPYFQSTSFTKGSIVYDDILYENVPLLYDMVLNRVVISDPANNFRITLAGEKISQFTILGHRFTRITEDTITGRPVIRTGFYDVLYKGNISILEKTEKSIQENPGTLENYIQEKNTFYLERKNMYYTINSESAILDVLKDRKKELKQFISANKLKFGSDNKAQSLASIAAYYDKIDR